MLDEALKTISTTPDVLINSPLVEAEAFYRLRNYPAQVTASLHHATVAIPRKLAYILHENPRSIAPAVEAFYLRDPVSLKALQTAKSDLIFPPNDLVTVSARFTKVLYAQLKSQRFSSPVAWRNIFSQPDEPADSPKDKQFTRLEMGMKVTSGFEMLVTDPKNSDNRVVREVKILLDDLDSEDNFALPSDEDIANWKDTDREDDEKWLDINFEDFERELQGKDNPNADTGFPGAFGPVPPSGFGDAKAQADLKKMVERFESFLNDENAGVDGAEMDDMDFDDDEEDSDEDSEDEDKDVSFDEKEFATMMREMMGMPSEEPDEDGAQPAKSKPILPKGQRILEIDSDEEGDDEDEAEELKKVMQRMEAELNEQGALNLDPTPRKLAALKENPQSPTDEKHSGQYSEEESDGEIDIDFNLAKNLLESFKSQAGMAGPGGNLMGMMGMQLPRDEDDTKSGYKT